MRYLIVDDDESIHLYLQVILSPYGECVTALSGEEAVDRFAAALAEGAPFDVVFMDILLPGMDGHEAAGAMRRAEASSGDAASFKLVMITCLVDDTNVNRAMSDARAELYITKPLDRESVSRQLRERGIL
ncbi:response regulator [Pseudodesulfovibrio indicus]|uniref:response regulator n=1 Tax=Pseudodesulfovibrio indicus TaxID=1716143 RepID=UPI00292D8DCC|nr:response regulator [Pseudodesulfovibrio indicus]